MSAACTLRAAQQADAPALAALLQGIGWFDRFATGHHDEHAAQLAPLLFLDARLAAQVAPRVAEILQQELPGVDVKLTDFLALCQQYRLAA